MNEKITLILDRMNGDLWLAIDGKHTSCTWDVTGLERAEGSFSSHVRILRNGKIIGGVWHVGEIEEKW